MRIAIFVDANNMFYSCRRLGFNVDYRKLTHFLEQKYREYSPRIILKRFYTGVPASMPERQASFLETVENMGYEIIKREIKEIINNQSAIMRKADMDATISFDIRDFFEQYDLLVLLGGDSDYERNLAIIQSRGKEILIISTYASIAKELRQLTYKMPNVEFIDLEDIYNEVGRDRREVMNIW